MKNYILVILVIIIVLTFGQSIKQGMIIEMQKEIIHVIEKRISILVDEIIRLKNIHNPDEHNEEIQPYRIDDLKEYINI